MKFTINREQVLAPLQQLVNVIEKKQTMVILSNVLLVVNENQLIMTGTDLEIQIIIAIDLQSQQQGEITIPAKKFLDIVRLLPAAAEIKIELKSDKVKISSGRSRFSLSSLDAQDYPSFSESELDHQFLMSAGMLKKAFEKTVFCMAAQDIRYYLNGMLFHITNSKLELVASDGHRLSIFEDSIGETTGYEERLVLPRKAVQELLRLLEDEEEELNIQFSDNHIRVYYKNIIFTAKLVDSDYPDFSGIFDFAFLDQIQIEKNILKDALNRVFILANEKVKGIDIEVSDGFLKLTAHNPEHDEAKEELAIVYQGQPLKLSMNCQYLMEAVANLDSEFAVLTFDKEARCCFIDDPQPQPYRFAVMAMLI